MAQRIDRVELRQAGARDHVQRLAGRVRKKVEVERFHPSLGLWKNMGKSLAQGSGQTQGQVSSAACPESPTSRRTAEKIHRRAVNSGDGARDSAQSRESGRVKLLAKFVRANKPRSFPLYYHQQTLLDSL
jgi:hypothetical protein